MRRTLLVISLCLLAAPPLRATVLIPAEFREVVTGSEIIVYGRVVDVRAEWTADRRGIDTLVTFEAATYLKGGPGETVTFRVPGGQIGRYRNVMVGAPEFRPGDEAVLFLRGEAPAIARVFGFSQGVFRVRVDPRTGQRIVVSPPLAARGDAPETVRRGAGARRSLALDAFAAEVRAAMQGGAR
jgi:hypothetical protein